MRCLYCGRTEEEVRGILLEQIQETYADIIERKKRTEQFQKAGDEMLEGIRNTLRPFVDLIPREMMDASIDSVNRLRSFLMGTPLGSVLEQMDKWARNGQAPWAITGDMTVAGFIKRIMNPGSGTGEGGLEATVNERDELLSVFSSCAVMKRTSVYLSTLGEVAPDRREGLFKVREMDAWRCKICGMGTEGPAPA